jgi:hypothetical protein
MCQAAVYANPDDPGNPILAPGPSGGGWCVPRPDAGMRVAGSSMIKGSSTN